MRSALLSVSALLLASCVAPLAAAPPPATRDRTPRYEYWCFDADGVPRSEQLARAGAEGWALASAVFRPPVVQNGSSVGGGATWLCFMRPAARASPHER
jgi:hypothetical protein